MKKPAIPYRNSFLLIIAFIFLCRNGNAVTGSAYLSGQSNHSGIRIVFTAQGGQATSDSCLTDAAGNYSVNIGGGYYQVKFQHAGYQNAFLNNGNALVLSNANVLTTFTLIPGTAAYVSGNVSGHWYGNTTYYVTSDITVPRDSVLTIDPGTVIKFMNNTRMVVNGLLYAEGDSLHRILFTPNSVTPWYGISLNIDSDSKIRYCTFESCNYAIGMQYCDPVISNCIIRNVDVGIYMNNAEPLIEKNEIVSFSIFGIYVSSASSASVTCNHIYNESFTPGDTAVGISLMHNNVIFANNNIHNLKAAVIIDDGCNGTLIRENYIHDNLTAILIRGTGSNGTIMNNTFLRNHDFCLNNISPNPSFNFINNLVDGSATAISFSGKNIACRFSLFYNCSTYFSAPFNSNIGQLTGTNANGDQTDIYHNVFTDPAFVPGNEPYLQPSSHALGAGQGVTGSTPDIGAHPASLCYIPQLVTGIHTYAAAENAVEFFPNPTSGIFTLKLKTAGKVVIYDAMGKVVSSQNFAAGQHEVNISQQNSGIYFISISSAGAVSTARLIKE